MRISTETIVGFFILVAMAMFFYMSYQIGSFRFDRMAYNEFIIYFQDVSGLSKKADVKISGVKVGWVSSLELVNQGQQVKATLMVHKKYTIYPDAYGIVRQEGFLGAKHLELIPGNPLLEPLVSGSMLTRPHRNTVTVDEMLHQFSDIAGKMQSVVTSLNKVLGGYAGEQQLRALMSNLESSLQHIASFSSRLDTLMGEHGTDMGTLFTDLRNSLPSLSNSLQRNVETVAQVIDRDFNRIATEIERGIAPIRIAVQTINEGKGVLGQLIHDEQTSEDVRTALSGIRTYFDKVDKIKIVFDIHTETMSGPMEGRQLTHESKSYANIRIHTAEDYFYMVGLIGTRNGRMSRYDETRTWFNDESHPLIPGELNLTDNDKLKYARYRRFKVRELDKMLFNVQFGKIFGNFAFRFGLFDSTGGVGMDIELPFGVGDLRWVSTFEAFDFSGVNRYCEDTREANTPHLKWLNRMFFTPQIYFTFGADDFISRYNKNAFFGIGLRFVDDDIKYLLSRITVLAPS